MSSTNNLLASELMDKFIQLKRDAAKKGEYPSRLELCQRLAQMAAPRFYISVDTALRMIVTPMNRDGKLPARGRRRAMHLELYKRYQILCASHKREEAMQLAIEQPAPSYYVSPFRINYLLYAALKRRNNHHQQG